MRIPELRDLWLQRLSGVQLQSRSAIQRRQHASTALCTGCMNPAACDFNPDATLAGACYDYTSCTGCTSEGADNYDPTATLNNDVCMFGGCTIPWGLQLRRDGQQQRWVL